MKRKINLFLLLMTCYVLNTEAVSTSLKNNNIKLVDKTIEEDDNNINHIIMTEYKDDEEILVQENPYEGKIIECEDGWKIIKSPLKKSYFINAGFEVYIKGDEKSEEIIIDVERSVSYNDSFIIRLYNTAIDMGSVYLGDEYIINYYQLFVMLGLAAEIPYKWETQYPSPFASAWKLNYDSFASRYNVEMLMRRFKQKFPHCKNIKLQLVNSNQKILLKHNYTWNSFYKELGKNGLNLVDNDGFDIETYPKVKILDAFELY
jgi:hypothetical protein